MPDYEEMYLTLMRAAEGALDLLIDAQRKCEQIYIEDKECESDAEALEE